MQPRRRPQPPRGLLGVPLAAQRPGLELQALRRAGAVASPTGLAEGAAGLGSGAGSAAGAGSEEDAGGGGGGFGATSAAGAAVTSPASSPEVSGTSRAAPFFCAPSPRAGPRRLGASAAASSFS